MECITTMNNNSSDNKDFLPNNTRKPHNYWNDLTPEQREKYLKKEEDEAKLRAAIAEREAWKKVADAQDDYDIKKLERYKLKPITDDGNGNGNGKARIDPPADLDPYIKNRDYAEFIIDVAKKTVKREDTLIRQIVYTALSKDSDNPLNLACTSRN